MRWVISKIFCLCRQTTQSSNESHKQHHSHKKGHVETLLEISGAVVNLVDEEKSVEIARGKFSLVRLVDKEDRSIALYIKVGDGLRWPLTKDQPIIKVDARHYLFSVRTPPTVEENAQSAKSGGGGPDVLNFGVTFGKIEEEERVELLDKWLKECACLSLPSGSRWWSWCLPRSEDKKSGGKDSGDSEAYWTVLAPKVEDYNSVMGKAIAGGSGYVIKGIFMCSNAYSSQVRKGGKLLRSRMKVSEKKKKKTSSEISPRVKKNVKRIKKLSQMTETMSNTVVEGVFTPFDAMGGFSAQSQCCQCCFRRMLPGGDVLLASLDAYNKILEAAHVAAEDAAGATSKVATEIVAQRYGEEAGEMTQDTMAIAGHAIGTGVNITKLTNLAVI